MEMPIEKPAGKQPDEADLIGFCCKGLALYRPEAEWLAPKTQTNELNARKYEFAWIFVLGSSQSKIQMCRDPSHINEDEGEHH